MYPESWIGKNGQLKWPTGSPDLKPLIFCLKELVYCELVEGKIIKCMTVMNQNLRLRLEMWIAKNRNVFECNL